MGKKLEKINIETLKAVDETIAKQLAKLYTKCIAERRIPKTWKEANMVIFFKKGNRKDIKNYRPICLLSNMYKLFTKIITTRLEKKLDEHKPREQAGFRSKYSTTDHMGKAHKNCIIGQKFCLHHITGTTFIIRLKLNVYIVENSDTFQKIYSFMQFK